MEGGSEHELHRRELSAHGQPDDAQGSSAAGSAFMDESLSVFDLLEEIHKALSLMRGKTFLEFDLVESRTNHNHDEIIENIETYQFSAIKSL